MAFKGTVDVGAALAAQGLPVNKITKLVANASNVTKNKKSGSNDLLRFDNIPFNYPILLSGANSNGGAFNYKAGIATGILNITLQGQGSSSSTFTFKADGTEGGFSTVNVILGAVNTLGNTIDVQNGSGSYSATTLSIGEGMLGSGTLAFSTPITSLTTFDATKARTDTQVRFLGTLTSSIIAPFTIKGASTALTTATFNNVVTASADKAVNVTFVAAGSILAITDNIGPDTKIINFTADSTNHANKLRMTWAGVISTKDAKVSNLDILSIIDSINASVGTLDLSDFIYLPENKISTIQLEQAPTAAASITNINDDSTVLISPISGAPFPITGTGVITYNLITDAATGTLNYSVKGLVDANLNSNPHQTFAIGNNVKKLNIAFDSHNINDTKVTLNTLSTALTNIALDAGGGATTTIELDLGSGVSIPAADVTISPTSFISGGTNILSAFKLSGSPNGSTNTYKVNFPNKLDDTFDISTFTSGNKVAIDSQDIPTIKGGDGDINFTDNSTNDGIIGSLTFGTGESNIVISGNNLRTYNSINLGAGDDTFMTSNSQTSTFNVVGAVSSSGENFWKYNATGQNKIIFVDNGSSGPTFLSGADHIKFRVDNQSVAGTTSALYDAGLGGKVKKSDYVTFSDPISGDCTTSCTGAISGTQSANVIYLNINQSNELSNIAITNIAITLPNPAAVGGETVLVNYKAGADSYLGALHYSEGDITPDSYVTLFKAKSYSAGFIATDFGFEDADGDNYFYEKTNNSMQIINSIQSTTKFYIANNVAELAGLVNTGYPVQAAVSTGGTREVISGGEAPVACDDVSGNWSSSSHGVYQVTSSVGSCNVINFSDEQNNQLTAADLANLQVSDGANANYNKVVILYHTATDSYLAIGQVATGESCTGSVCSITGLTNAYEILNDSTTLSSSNIGFYGDFIGIGG